MLSYPLRVAVAGLGGFAGAHHKALLCLENLGLARVIATCDPAADHLTDFQASCRFKERGVAVYDSLDALLDLHGSSLDVVTIATPITCHAEHHRACVKRGIACYLEKPPTLDPSELEDMIAVETLAEKATQVGFNHIAQPWRQRLKKRILTGEFGAVREVGFSGLWRRPAQYYRRNAWAGRLRIGHQAVLDSCCGNAMAHHLHNMLFYAGASRVMSWAEPEEVAAELYRANLIESADTVFARGHLAHGVQFKLLATHACETATHHREYVRCEEAEIEMREDGQAQILHRDGRIEPMFAPSPVAIDLLKENLQGYFDYLVGHQPRPATFLRDCRPFVHLNALLFIAGGQIRQIPGDYLLHTTPEPEHSEVIAIRGILRSSQDFMKSGKLPSEQNLPWAAPGGVCTATDLDSLTTALDQMTQQAPAPNSAKPITAQAAP